MTLFLCGPLYIPAPCPSLGPPALVLAPNLHLPVQDKKLALVLLLPQILVLSLPLPLTPPLLLQLLIFATTNNNNKRCLPGSKIRIKWSLNIYLMKKSSPVSLQWPTCSWSGKQHLFSKKLAAGCFWN